MRILAVDDDPILRELLLETLNVLGYEDVVSTASGKEALAAIAEASSPFDCFLLDIQMPEIDGIELCVKIKSYPEYKMAQVIMLTSMSDRAYVDSAFAAGATDYVTKPFDGLELDTRLKLANRITLERRDAAKKISDLKLQQGTSADKIVIKHDDPITIEDVQGVVDHLVLENYLLQLSRGSTFLVTVTGFHIKNFENLYARSTGEDLYYTLTDIAEAISEQFKFSFFLMSYMGNGIYVVVTDRNNAVIHDDLEASIQMAIEEMDLTLESGEKCNITVGVGDAQTDRLFFRVGPMGLVEAAMESAVNRQLPSSYNQKMKHSRLLPRVWAQRAI